MKKFIVVILTLLTALCAAFAFSACGGFPNSSGGQQATIQYTVNFYDEEGELLESKKWDKDSTPSYSYNKQDTEDWHYSFEGWATSINGEKLAALPEVSAESCIFAVGNRQFLAPYH